VRRFNFYRDRESEVECLCEMEEAANGLYVTYEDHMKEVGKFQTAIASMERRIKIIKKELGVI
jgi:hypothetical protein